MKILTDTIYVHFSKRTKSFFLPEPELLTDYPDISTIVNKLVDHMNTMRTIRRFNYSPIIYACFILMILCTILVYYYKYLTIAALAFLALMMLFLLLKHCKSKAVDKELSNVVFDHLEELRPHFEIDIKSCEFFAEFKRTPAIILVPRNPFGQLLKAADLKFIVDDNSHLSLSLSVQQKDLASKQLGRFFENAKERGMMISANKKAELYRHTRTKQVDDNDMPIQDIKNDSPLNENEIVPERDEEGGQEQISRTEYTIDQMKCIVHQNFHN